MPFIDIDPIPLGAQIDTPQGFAVTPGEDEINKGSDASVRSVWGAAFRTQNTIGAAISAQDIGAGDMEPEEGFNPWNVVKGTKYEPYWKSFADIRSNPAAALRKRQIDQEVEDHRNSEGAPWYVSLPADLTASVIDWPNLLPGGAFVKGVKGGFSVARSGLSVGAAAFASTAVQETVLHQLQETRTLEETGTALAASTILGGLLGSAGAGLLSHGEWSRAVRNVDIEADLGVRVPGEIYDDVLGKLQATGVSEDEAKLHAALYAARYKARASRLGDGVSAEDLYRSEPFEVHGPETASEPIGGKSFAQSWIDELIAKAKSEPVENPVQVNTELFTASQRRGPQFVDPTSKEWTLFHGSDAAGIERFDPEMRRDGQQKMGAEYGAIFFSPSPGEAGGYGGNIYKVRINPGKTKVYDLRDLFENSEEFHEMVSQRQHELSGSRGFSGDRIDRDLQERYDRAMSQRQSHLKFIEDAKNSDWYPDKSGIPGPLEWGFPYNYGAVDAVIQMAKKEGLDTVVIRGLEESQGGDQIAVLNPNRVFGAYTGKEMFQGARPVRPQDISAGPDGRTMLFERDLDVWRSAQREMLAGDTKLDDVRVLRRNPVLQTLTGWGKQITIAPIAARAIAKKHPDVAAVWLDLPDLLADPIFAFPHREGGTIVAIDARTPDGDPIVVGVRDGQVKTITPQHGNERETGDEGLMRRVLSEIQDGKKVYVRDARVIDAIETYSAREPGDNSTRRDSVSQGANLPYASRASDRQIGARPSRRNLIYRDDVIKRWERVFYQGSGPGPSAPTFYSAVEQVVSGAKQAKASPDQWLGTIKNASGVKQEELDWLGLADWLKEQKGAVTKDQVLDYVRANQIEVKEVEHGSAPEVDTTGYSAELNANETLWRIIGPDGQQRTIVGVGEADTPEDAIRWALRDIARVEGDFTPTKFGSYTVPGGENYRELLLTLPRKETAGAPLKGGDGDDLDNLALLPGEPTVNRAPEYISSHWDEPNVLAHVRFNDRVIDGKKTLLVEEVQSDWHQEGRKKGYDTEERKAESAARLRELDRERRSIAEQMDPLPADDVEYLDLGRRLHEINAERHPLLAGGVPDAPFKTTWPELAMKRMIRYAAENGYERIAWAPGHVQAARYDLSKKVSELYHWREDDGSVGLSIYDQDGRAIVDQHIVQADNLDDVVGKELAERILKGEGESAPGQPANVRLLQEDGLKIGGEGMLSFYDRELPNTVNKLVKKFGARVERTEMAGPDVKGRLAEIEQQIADARARGDRDTQMDLAAERMKLEADGDTGDVSVHSLDITPQLREVAVSKGFPLFQGGAEDARGRITFAEGKAVIDLFANADKSTFLHESGHKWLEELISDAARADAPQGLKDDLDAILKWMGIEKPEDIKVEHHEQFARGIETYFAEGKAPSAALAQAFEKFKEWLLAIYKTLTAINSPISDDVRGVFDRMLATDVEIAAVRSGEVPLVPGSVGAAANMPTSLEGNSIAGRMASAVARSTSRLNPVLRALTSPSPAYRETATNLFENPVYLKKNFDGVASAPAVETLMKEWNGGLAKAVSMTATAWPDYRKAGGQLSRHDFREAVGRAMRRGDEDADPFITKVAKTWRSEVFDPLKEAAIAVRLLPPDVTVETAASYFSRMWDRNKLIAREGSFKDIVRQWVADNAPRWAQAFDQQAERSILPLRREIDDIEMAKLRRGEEARRREEGGEVSAGEFNEADIRQALRIVEGGAPRPKGVKTLTQFVADAGGLVDFSGELAHRGINNKARPGFVRKERKRIQAPGGGWAIDEMARHAWERGYFPDHIDGRPTNDEFLNALQDDFFKVRAVLPLEERDAFRLQELVDRLDQDLARVGVREAKGTRFSISEEVKGIVSRVYKALDAEADEQLKKLRAKLVERETAAAQERDARFLGDPNELGRHVADEVFAKLTGKTDGEIIPEFITVNARGPLKERTFNIPDALVEDFLESDVEMVGRRYARVMGADVELARKFGSPDMVEQVQKIREDYERLRAGVKDEQELKRISDHEKRDITDLESLRDLLRGQSIYKHPVEHSYARIVRMANHINYIRSMGEVVLASLTDAVRPAMVHGLGAYMGGIGQLLTNLSAVKLSVEEAQLAGNVLERVLGTRLATISEITDPYSSRGPIEAFLENMTNLGSKWNGIRIWTDAMKSVASVLTQNRILKNVEGFAKAEPSERAYLAFLGIDEGMAGRIATQFTAHGETIDGVRVANTRSWSDQVAVRTYRAAMNKDVDSIIVVKGVGDTPLFANTPTGRALLQFKTFTLASHQRVLLRGLQEDQSRFVGGLVAMTIMGMFITYMKGITGNRPETQAKALNNPGWWIGEGFDRAGVLGVPMEIANTFEKMTGFNPIKLRTPIEGVGAGGESQKNQNRNVLGSLLGPTAGLVEDTAAVAGVPGAVLRGKDITKAQKNSAERLLPFNSYLGLRQMLKYVVNPPAQ